jgi:hypothetical protein
VRLSQEIVEVRCLINNELDKLKGVDKKDRGARGHRIKNFFIFKEVVVSAE